MTVHSYRVQLRVQRDEEVIVELDDADPMWNELPSLSTLEREAINKAYRECPHECFVADIEKIAP